MQRKNIISGSGRWGSQVFWRGALQSLQGSGLQDRPRSVLAFISAAVLFLPLFVFMPKLVQCAMKADAEAVINAFGKNEQVKKVFWTLFVAMAGLVMARVVDPVTSSAGGRDYYGDGGVRKRIYTSFL